jgi:hypothetical protein
MKLTTTRNLITSNAACEEGLERFDQAYPNINGDQEVDLLDMINNGHNIIQDVIWALRATVQDSKQVSVEFAKRCATRAAAYAAARAAAHAAAVYARDAAVYARDAAADAADCAAYAAADAADYAAYAATRAVAERDKQKQDMIELLS